MVRAGSECRLGATRSPHLYGPSRIEEYRMPFISVRVFSRTFTQNKARESSMSDLGALDAWQPKFKKWTDEAIPLIAEANAKSVEPTRA